MTTLALAVTQVEAGSMDSVAVTFEVKWLGGTRKTACGSVTNALESYPLKSEAELPLLFSSKKRYLIKNFLKKFQKL